MSDSTVIDFTLNGRPVRVDVDPLRPLLLVLREDLGLTGAKQGCDLEGECGACTVILDGTAVRSCLLPVAKVAGRTVTTVEGLGTKESPHPLQTAFLEAGAVQCGYCTPGMLMAAAALLARQPHPSRAEIMSALSGNLCRCTGYVKIIDAVERASGGGEGKKRTLLPLSSPAFREGGWERVTGAAKYGEDITMPGLRHLKVARSPHTHARLLALDRGPALAVPGVLRVFTAADVPGDNAGLGGYSPGEHLLCPVGGTVRMAGDPVALVAAVTPEAAQAGAAAVAAEYEILPPVLDPAVALAPDAAPLHPGGKLLAESRVRTGDTEAASDGLQAAVTATYRTGLGLPAALERETALAYPDEDGKLAVIAGCHEPHWNRDYIARILALPPDRVRVAAPPMGGSFGGKQDVWPLAAAALAAYHLSEPVRLAYTRREVMEATPKRHPYTTRCSIAARPGGRLAALRFDALIDTGAYDSGGSHTAGYATVAAVGPYRWEAVDARARTVYTNNPKAGQMRGYGTPQAVLAVECTLDELIRRIGADPLAFRRANALRDGETSGLGFPVADTLGFVQCLDALAPDYHDALARAAAFNAGHDARLRRGVGLAGMWYRYGKFGRTFSQAEAELGLDGVITVYCSSVDYGQGVGTVFLQLAGRALGLPPEALRLVAADTARTLDADIPGASRNTFWAGSAVADAARRLRGAILGAAAELLDVAFQPVVTAEAVSTDGAQSAARLVLTPEGVSLAHDPTRHVPLSTVALEMQQAGHPRRLRGVLDLSAVFGPDYKGLLHARSGAGSPITDLQFPGSSPGPSAARSYLPLFVTGAQLAEVEVDRATGDVRVLLIAAAHDVGRAINPRDAEGQIEGGIVMGLGAALMEEYLPGLTEGFGDYLVPTAASTPEIRVHLVEVPGRWGPDGAKGLGEAVSLPPAPAILNAIADATGARVREIPATPERVLAAIRGAS